MQWRRSSAESGQISLFKLLRISLYRPERPFYLLSKFGELESRRSFLAEQPAPQALQQLIVPPMTLHRQLRVRVRRAGTVLRGPRKNSAANFYAEKKPIEMTVMSSMSFDVRRSNPAGWLKTFWTRSGDSPRVALRDVVYHDITTDEAPTPLRGMSTAAGLFSSRIETPKHPRRCSSSAKA